MLGQFVAIDVVFAHLIDDFDLIADSVLAGCEVFAAGCLHACNQVFFWKVLQDGHAEVTGAPPT